MPKLARILLVTTILIFLSVSVYSEQIYAIKAGHLIDGKSDVLHHGVVIIIKGNKITAIGKDLDIPKEASLLDFSDNTVLPGFIDAHTHIMTDGIRFGDDLYKNSVSFRTIRAVASVRKALWNGFTAMRDVGSEGTMYADVDVKKAINKGLIPGPRLWVSTRGLSITGRYMPFGYSWHLKLPKGCQIVNGPEECLKAVREQVAHGADWIKIFADWGGNVNFTEEELSIIVNEAHRLNRKVAAHAISRDGIKAALGAGVDSIEHGYLFDDELIAQAKKQGVYWCPTLLIGGENLPEFIFKALNNNYYGF